MVVTFYITVTVFLIICMSDHIVCMYDIGDLKFNPVTIKEGTSYKIKIIFRIQSEIVSGLLYAQNSFRNK